MVQVAKCLPIMLEALGSIPKTEKEKEKKTKKKIPKTCILKSK
jgi:hypothetical protein